MPPKRSRTALASLAAEETTAAAADGGVKRARVSKKSSTSLAAAAAEAPADATAVDVVSGKLDAAEVPASSTAPVAGKKVALAPSPYDGPRDFEPMPLSECTPAASWAAFIASLPVPSKSASSVAPGCGKILSVNVNGLRSLLNKVGGELQRWLEAEAASVLVLQEVKADVDAVTKCGLATAFPALPHARFACSGPPAKKGYSGVAIFSAHAPIAWHEGIGDKAIDAEGRVLAAEFETHYVVVVYVPNSGAKLDRLAWRTQHFDPAFAAYLRRMQAVKPVVVLGDYNVAYHAYDVADPKKYRNKIAGFVDAERENWHNLILNSGAAGAGLVDAWRESYPKRQLYTYYSIMHKGRATGRGWRIDGSLVSPALMPRVRDCFVRGTIPADAGLDHLPVGLTLL